MSPALNEHIDYLTRQALREQAKRRALEARLQAIYEQAEAELGRIERDGGCCGFALRIRRLSRREGPK